MSTGECTTDQGYLFISTVEPLITRLRKVPRSIALLEEIAKDLQGATMVRQDWSDDDLAQRLRERDHEALETLISRYSREMLYFIRMVLDRVGAMQDAEECLYDLFMAVWNEIDTFDPGRGTLRTWVTMRAKFIALDRRRQLMRRQTHHWQPADETRQWNSSDVNGNRSLSGWRWYEQENRAT